MTRTGETGASPSSITDKARRLVDTVHRISSHPSVFQETKVYLLDTIGQSKKEADSILRVGMEVIGALGLNGTFFSTEPKPFENDDGRTGTRTVMQALDGRVRLEWIEMAADHHQPADVRLLAMPARLPLQG